MRRDAKAEAASIRESNRWWRQCWPALTFSTAAYADPNASSLVTSFAMKWLNLTTLDQVVPDPKLFPHFNDQLRRDFYNEAEAFLGSILLEDRPVVDLLTADYTFLNERLAQHYGISGVLGPQLRRVTLTEKERFG